MEWLQTHAVSCPFCGESIELLIDCSVSAQEYVEDCQVCCRPLVVNVLVDDDGAATVNVRNENE